jgi:MerR family transcriptional regulator, light-induced transcriptional regulator
MNRFSIKDLENLTGIKAHTIRIWEQRYGILQPKRTATNIRYYDADDLKLALRVSLLNNHGYKISRIHEMKEHEIQDLIRKINTENFLLEALINELLEATLAMDMDLFEQIIDNYIEKNGFEYTIEYLVFHFLEKVGLMWVTDRLYPGQEHLVSNILYRKIAAAIEKLPRKHKEHSKTVLLFLPEGEMHDMGLLYVHYLLQKYGKKPIYLGSNAPIDDVKLIFDARKPQYLYVHLSSVAATFNGQKFMQRIADEFPNVTIFISGNQVGKGLEPINDNMKFLTSLNEVRTVLMEL